MQPSIISPATEYLNAVIPAKANQRRSLAGIQKDTGCRIESGMTGLLYSSAALIIFPDLA
jgi:hypothetical protein